MSMIICHSCERCLDAKDEGIEGIYGDDSPFEYLCPGCVEDVADEFGIEDVDYQDQRIIHAYRNEIPSSATEAAKSSAAKTLSKAATPTRSVKPAPKSGSVGRAATKRAVSRVTSKKR